MGRQCVCCEPPGIIDNDQLPVHRDGALPVERSDGPSGRGLGAAPYFLSRRRSERVNGEVSLHEDEAAGDKGRAAGNRVGVCQREWAFPRSAGDHLVGGEAAALCDEDPGGALGVNPHRRLREDPDRAGVRRIC